MAHQPKTSTKPGMRATKALAMAGGTPAGMVMTRLRLTKKRKTSIETTATTMAVNSPRLSRNWSASASKPVRTGAAMIMNAMKVKITGMAGSSPRLPGQGVGDRDGDEDRQQPVRGVEGDPEPGSQVRIHDVTQVAARPFRQAAGELQDQQGESTDDEQRHHRHEPVAHGGQGRLIGDGGHELHGVCQPIGPALLTLRGFHLTQLLFCIERRWKTSLARYLVPSHLLQRRAAGPPRRSHPSP